MNPLWLLKIFGMVSGVNVKKVFGFIASYWKIFLIAVLAAVVGYQNFSDTRFLFWAQTIPALQAELAESQNNLKICGDGNAKLSDAIEKNNAIPIGINIPSIKAPMPKGPVRPFPVSVNPNTFSSPIKPRPN